MPFAAAFAIEMLAVVRLLSVAEIGPIQAEPWIWIAPARVCGLSIVPFQRECSGTVGDGSISVAWWQLPKAASVVTTTSRSRHLACMGTPVWWGPERYG